MQIIPSGQDAFDPSVVSKKDMLFECEHHILVEYVESVIPMMYAIYLLIVGRLSSTQYYPEIQGKSTTQVEFMVLNIAAYAMIEVLSLIGMQGYDKWRSSLSPVYLLTFVIENQAQVLLGQLFVWYGTLLQLTLAHFGTFLIAAVCVAEPTVLCGRRGLYTAVHLASLLTWVHFFCDFE